MTAEQFGPYRLATKGSLETLIGSGAMGEVRCQARPRVSLCEHTRIGWAGRVT